MNLHQVAIGLTSSINPTIPVTIKVAAGGYTTQPDGTRTPTYLTPQTLPGDVQPMSWRDIQMTDGLNLQGTRYSIYVNGVVNGLVRETNKGGDIITIVDGPSAGTYLCALVLEQWPNWVKFAATRQLDTSGFLLVNAGQPMYSGGTIPILVR